MNGLYRYDGTRIVRVAGDQTFGFYKFHHTPDGLLVGASNGLFRYDGTRTIHVEGEPTGPVYSFLDTPDGLLLGADEGLFRLNFQPLSTATTVLANAAQLREAATSQLGILTRWIMIHPCSAILDKFNLHVIATSATDAKPARDFRP